MTKINKIVLDGFKSFGKRTELLFGNNFNCVLGPNGSGKSNILDALAFVLGKSSSKSMRAEKTANLIYNGGKSKKGAKQGEVSIFFDNSTKIFPTKDQVLKVSRFIKKDGASKYKINDESRTRQQVVDVLNYGRIHPDAYNIIMQGDIVLMKSQEYLSMKKRKTKQ
jgi:chromosome segregation protein